MKTLLREAPNRLDIYSKTLFTDTPRCLFDSNQVSAQEAAKQYIQLDHATVQFGDKKPRMVDQILKPLGLSRNIKLVTPSFEALPSLIRDTRLIATVPSRLQDSLFAGFGSTPLSFAIPLISLKCLST